MWEFTEVFIESINILLSIINALNQTNDVFNFLAESFSSFLSINSLSEEV